jgi:3-dehydroquinate dehydratase
MKRFCLGRAAAPYDAVTRGDTMKILVLNGPNLNLLGVREPEIYGNRSYNELCKYIEAHAAEIGVEVEIRQTNHEGVLVDWVQAAGGFYDQIPAPGNSFENVREPRARFDGVVLNPGAYTHTSVALLDAVLAAGVPTVEVHISDPMTRESFRRVSYVRAACVKTIAGKGFDGYLEAMDDLKLKIER